jgi:hypothetical protein
MESGQAVPPLHLGAGDVGSTAPRSIMNKGLQKMLAPNQKISCLSDYFVMCGLQRAIHNVVETNPRQSYY